jgi:DNA mismatch endonuclease (patch repair protein)
MPDFLSPTERSERMALIRSKNTGPELLIRKLLYSLGYRYRIHGIGLPGRPDIVFPGRGKVIFVHGCFWHWHREASCKIAHLPESRRDYWGPKLQRNRNRDETVRRDLLERGWESITVWECQLTDLPALKAQLVSFLGKPQKG